MTRDSAALRADAQPAKGDQLACAVWMKVYRAIEALKREKPRDGEFIN